MGTALYKVKVMPESPEVKLEELQGKISEKIKEIEGEVTGFEEESIAFGLKALIVNVKISEDIDSSKVEDSFKNIEGISSSDVIDYRRALE